MSKTVAELIVDMLQKAGVKRCYGVPGDTLNFFTDAVRRSDIRWVHVRHEEAGAFAAGADAFVSGELTACAGSCGPGSLHFINGIFEAQRNRAPVILIASQLPQDMLNSEFPQEVDFQTVYGSTSVYCSQISTNTQAARKIALAIQTAINKGGVSVLIVPSDVANQSVSDKESVASMPRRAVASCTPLEEELREIAKILNDSQTVTIYGGIGCKDAHDEVVALGEKLKAPIARTSRAKDFLEHDNPHDVGMIGVFGHESGVYAVNKCQTLLILGSDFAWTQFYPKDATIIQVDVDATHLGRRHPVHLGVVGDVRSTVNALLPMITPKTDDAFLGECRKHYQESVEHYDKRAVPGKEGKLRPQFVFRTIDDLADQDALFTADVGSPMVWILRHITANGKRRTLSSYRHGTMANAMPQALGLKAAYPDRQVVAFCGDGGLAMLLGDLLTTIQENLAIKAVVLNNGSLFFVELEQRAEGLLDAFTNLENPNFANVARAIGLWSRRVETADELGDAAKEFLGHNGPALLEVMVDREITMPPTYTFEQVKGMALYTAKAIVGGRSDDLMAMLKDNF